MTQTKELLVATLEDLNMASKHLLISHKKCTKFAKKKKLTPTELEFLEALTARFARVVDLLFKRAYRSILAFELEEPGTYLDLLNKMEKRGLIESLDDMRNIKDIRNMIAHEYAKNNFSQIVKEVMQHTPYVFNLIKKINAYSKNLLK